MDTSDIEKQLMGSLKASEPTDPKDKEIADLKHQLAIADERCASFMAAFVGDAFERKIASLKKAKEEALSNRNGGTDLVAITFALTAWDEALKILFEHTAKDSAALKALAKSPQEKPLDKRVETSMLKIIAALLNMATQLSGKSLNGKIDKIRERATLSGIPFPASNDTVSPHLKAALELIPAQTSD